MADLTTKLKWLHLIFLKRKKNEDSKDPRPSSIAFLVRYPIIDFPTSKRKGTSPLGLKK